MTQNTMRKMEKRIRTDRIIITAGTAGRKGQAGKKLLQNFENIRFIMRFSCYFFHKEHHVYWQEMNSVTPKRAIIMFTARTILSDGRTGGGWKRKRRYMILLKNWFYLEKSMIFWHPRGNFRGLIWVAVAFLMYRIMARKLGRCRKKYQADSLEYITVEPGRRMRIAMWHIICTGWSTYLRCRRCLRDMGGM